MIYSPKWPRLARRDIEMLHESAVAVLSDKGLKFYDADLRRTLEVAGAVVSEEIGRAHV